ncbi:hypothetical protein FKM82_027284, partial [Ascaphus truei]
ALVTPLSPAPELGRDWELGFGLQFLQGGGIIAGERRGLAGDFSLSPSLLTGSFPAAPRVPQPLGSRRRYHVEQRSLCGVVKMSSFASCLSWVIVLLTATVTSASVTSSEWGEAGVKYGKIGASITLVCVDKNDSAVAMWRFNGAEDIPWGFITQLGHLELANTELSAVGNYSCHDQSGGLLGFVLLRVGCESDF